MNPIISVNNLLNGQPVKPRLRDILQEHFNISVKLNEHPLAFITGNQLVSPKTLLSTLVRAGVDHVRSCFGYTISPLSHS